MKSSENNTFEESLDLLSADDLAPAPSKKKSSSGRILSKALWLVLCLALLAVFLFSSARVVINLVDFYNTQNSYDNIAGDFSPITAVVETPPRLTLCKALYPMADLEDIIAGKAIYPTSPSPSDGPILNSGGNSTSVSSKTDPPSESIPPSASPDTSYSPTPSAPPAEPDPLLSEEKFLYFKDQLDSLQKKCKNTDIFAWIYIPGTNIDYPVVIGKDNDYYLQKDVYKKYSSAGSLFLDYRNQRNLLNNSFSVIYGHNVRSAGIMFNRLLEFLNEKTFQKYRYIYVYTKDAALKYEIFSAYVDNSYQSPSIDAIRLSGSRFLTAIQRIQNNSLHQRQGLTLKETDHVLMLYTCANTQMNDDRCMVFGVLVDYIR